MFPPPAISSKTVPIAGILTTIYGLAELPDDDDDGDGDGDGDAIACLWLLHPRLGTKERMTAIGTEVIRRYNDDDGKEEEAGDGRRRRRRGLIAVAFDQRNHGSRLVAPRANEGWREGNPSHALDMFGILNGTALDAGALMDQLESYLERRVVVVQHLVLGVSLGGHTAWQVLFREPRVAAAVVINGCPDYMRMMQDRARLSKRETYLHDGGASFLGSVDFPPALIARCLKYDPKGLLFGTRDIVTSPSALQQVELRPKLDATLRGKAVLVCSGADDRFVPYSNSKNFLNFLKHATRPNGWYADGGVHVEDNVYPGVEHVFSAGMVQDSVRFLLNVLHGRDPEPEKRPVSNP
ncbi:MAG: hypothetical protein M1818_005894 [Claussenomyces sp. TS43310]|nr:MAG: hypothetical protein M1818_005894 [Claussenomyces sp. TS43310]